MLHWNREKNDFVNDPLSTHGERAGRGREIMNVRIACPNAECGKSYSVPDGSLGRAAKCTGCGQKFTLGAEANDTHVGEENPETKAASPPAIPKQIPRQESPSTLVPPSPVPSQLGRFEIGSRLGAGAFGAVYRGYDPTLGREVALKVPHPGSLDSQKAKERFLREPKAAAQLRHPNIVPVHDAGVDGDTYYIATAFIDGQTLKDAIEAKPFDFQKSVRIVRELAEAPRTSLFSANLEIHRHHNVIVTDLENMHEEARM